MKVPGSSSLTWIMVFNHAAKCNLSFFASSTSLCLFEVAITDHDEGMQNSKLQLRGREAGTDVKKIGGKASGQD